MSMNKKITIDFFRRKKKKGEKITALTAYDATTGRLAEKCGIDLILVGDSLGMTHLGYLNTIPVSVEEMLHHTKAVIRGVENAFVVTDMPFMSYQVSAEEALRNAGMFLKQGGADAVKIEGGKGMAATVGRLVNAGIPVLSHIGLLPQSVLTSGGYKIAGKTEDDAERLLADALQLQQAGAFCIVLEGIPAGVSKKISETLEIPTIGIGAGVHCDGQIQVINDILGLFTDFVPKHTKQYANLTETITQSINTYIREVRESEFPGREHSF